MLYLKHMTHKALHTPQHILTTSKRPPSHNINNSEPKIIVNTEKKHLLLYKNI